VCVCLCVSLSMHSSSRIPTESWEHSNDSYFYSEGSYLPRACRRVRWESKNAKNRQKLSSSSFLEIKENNCCTLNFKLARVVLDRRRRRRHIESIIPKEQGKRLDDVVARASGLAMRGERAGRRLLTAYRSCPTISYISTIKLDNYIGFRHCFFTILVGKIVKW
jgi:hypothetical protein